MKKILFLLLALPLMLVSCHDDNYPEVRVGVDMSGGYTLDGERYAVRGDTLTVDSVFVVPVDPSKTTYISQIFYSLDGIALDYPGYLPPFGVELLTSNLATGRHTLGIRMQVLQVGASIGNTTVLIPFTVVASPDDLPDGAVPDFPDQDIVPEFEK